MNPMFFPHQIFDKLWSTLFTIDHVNCLTTTTVVA
jgi:hypothetical protein